VVVEGLVTTENADGSPHLAPMGPTVDAEMNRFVLRPFATSTTLANLRRTGRGVLHITDDVELIAAAAIGQIEPRPRYLRSADQGRWILADCCRWYAFRVQSLDDHGPRIEIHAKVDAWGNVRDFCGFNRAKHAVVEAAILATRVALISAEELHGEFARLTPLVEKTGGPAERRAFERLREYVGRARPPRQVRVLAASRLHFGMFSFGQPDLRQYGGVGAMIDRPGLQVELMPNDQLSASGPLADRAVEVARLAARAWRLPDDPRCHIEVLAAPPAHAGLGVGTQLSLSIARGLRALLGLSPCPAPQLAEAVGRAARSAIGTHGFEHGGLLVEGGKLAAHERSPLLARVDVPDPWRFVLFRPQGVRGISGAAERQAFERLPAMTAEATRWLAFETLTHLLPAAATAQFEEFCDSLERFGRRAGDSFAATQGGPYSQPELVAALRSIGARGVGQSSWGPTTFAIEPDAESAAGLVDRWRCVAGADGVDVAVAAPANRGAQCILG
jgi:beta-ribofuranosylaminobenzene 5'-phosphate synthase